MCPRSCDSPLYFGIYEGHLTIEMLLPPSTATSETRVVGERLADGHVLLFPSVFLSRWGCLWVVDVEPHGTC